MPRAMNQSYLRLFEVDVGRIFPPNSPQSVPLLQFMAAVNDTITVQLCFLGVNEGKGTEGERLLAAARRNYFFRLACGHLYEGLSAFRRAVRANALQGMVERMPPEGRQAFETLLAASDPDNRDTFYYRVLKPIRDYGIFHYLPEKFHQALSTYPQDKKSYLVLAPIHADTRFILADDLIYRISLLPTIGSDGSYEAVHAVSQVASLLGALAEFLHSLLVVLVDENRDAIREILG